MRLTNNVRSEFEQCMTWWYHYRLSDEYAAWVKQEKDRILAEAIEGEARDWLTAMPESLQEKYRLSDRWSRFYIRGTGYTDTSWALVPPGDRGYSDESWRFSGLVPGTDIPLPWSYTYVTSGFAQRHAVVARMRDDAKKLLESKRRLAAFRAALEAARSMKQLISLRPDLQRFVEVFREAYREAEADSKNVVWVFKEKIAQEEP